MTIPPNTKSRIVPQMTTRHGIFFAPRSLPMTNAMIVNAINPTADCARSATVPRGTNGSACATAGSKSAEIRNTTRMKCRWHMALRIRLSKNGRPPPRRGHSIVGFRNRRKLFASHAPGGRIGSDAHECSSYSAARIRQSTHGRPPTRPGYSMVGFRNGNRRFGFLWGALMALSLPK